MEKTSDKILAYIAERGQASGKGLADHLGITDRAVRKQLYFLFESGRVDKIGKPPRVFYILPKKHYILKGETGGHNLSLDDISSVRFSVQESKVIQENFLYITSQGKRLEGISGFVRWCKDRSFSVEQKASEYVRIYEKYNALKKHGLISGKKKMRDTFADKPCLDDVFYVDFYSWEIFGKTKLGQLLLYGKQSQNRKIMLEVAESVRSHVDTLIEKYEIGAVGFVPPTVKRETQFMKVLEQKLNVPVPILRMEKIKTEIITPQKTLSRLRDRIENAEHSMVVTDTRSFKKVLLIDDAVGSGATLNQIACKIKRLNVAHTVYGFSVTGSVKGFDVISEV